MRVSRGLGSSEKNSIKETWNQRFFKSFTLLSLIKKLIKAREYLPRRDNVNCQVILVAIFNKIAFPRAVIT